MVLNLKIKSSTSFYDFHIIKLHHSKSVARETNPFAVRQFLSIVIEGVFQENIPNIQYGSQLQNVLLEVRVLHRFISRQLRIRFWVISSLLLDDSENKENQTFIYLYSLRGLPKATFPYANPFSTPQRGELF